MLFHFTKNYSQAGCAEQLYWRNYIAIYFVSFIVLLQFVGIIEAILLAWMLADVLGFAFIILSAFSFIANALAAKLRKKINLRI